MGNNEMTTATGLDKVDSMAEETRTRTLGTVRLRHHETNEIILIPTPSNDPNDPLNWPQAYKYYMATVICLAMLMCNFLAAGPTIAIVSTAMDFSPTAPVPTAISKVAYFFTTTALLQGVSNFVWVPLTNKFGRRPIYVTSYALYFACTVWLIFEKSYGGFLAGRILIGIGAGAAETIAPVSIADVFFLHERGFVMSMYTCFLSIGVALGILIDGLIVINHDWRVIYQVAAGLVGFVLVLAFFTFPETAYIREIPSVAVAEHSTLDKPHGSNSSDLESSTAPQPRKQTYLESIRMFHRVWTAESLVKMFVRPLGLILLPPVLWAALVQSVTIGFVVAVTSNVASAYSTAYGFEPWQIGLCFIAAIIGSLLGIPAGGQLADMTADWFTKRNGGIRVPEMRLPAMTLCLVTAPLSLILYGVGIEKQLHWICPTIGLGLLNFSISQGTNVCLVYVIDAYRPVAGEITLSVMGFKSLFGFLLSFYTNPWVEQAGYLNAFGAMAGIAAAVLLFWIPLYIWGKAIRHATWNWKMLSYIRWEDDREVGE
ncbi:putative Major facilitator superfamily (MFS) profile domain-containing protein [Seiridium cardinale]|uniref:Major facilitator superfamily (MFS) profile domain-containing protein n=1 Tax=Seiridium cardinale TaxID=138064 RepID=A0ABR2XSX7_9PEZI